MIIPNFENIRFTDGRGNLTPQWQNILQALFTALQGGVSDEGFAMPQQSAANIAKLQSQFAAASDPSVYYGRIVYDVTNNQLKVFLSDNAFHVITTV